MEDYPGWAGGRLESGSFGDEPDGVRFLNFPQMNDIEIGWLAGIIDGEGSVSLDPRNDSRYPRISVPSTDMAILEKCKRITKVGSITPRHSRRSPKHSPTWQWRISGSRQVVEVLKQIQEHLACPKKKARAQFLILHLNDLCKIGGNYSPAELKKRAELQRAFFQL